MAVAAAVVPVSVSSCHLLSAISAVVLLVVAAVVAAVVIVVVVAVAVVVAVVVVVVAVVHVPLGAVAGIQREGICLPVSIHPTTHGLELAWH